MMSVNIKCDGSRLTRAMLFGSVCVASFGAAFHASNSWAQGPTAVFQNFDGPSVPRNLEGVPYPTWYDGGSFEGGEFTPSIDTSKKIAGSGSLKMRLTSGLGLYARWHPWDGFGRAFAREYAANPDQWQFNTYNRMRYWFWNATNGEAVPTTGEHNFYMGTYVKRVANADTSSDEEGGGHYYHPFNVRRGAWSLCIFNTHPGHERGQAGGEDTGNRLYPTTDRANTYNYFDALTTWYISHNINNPSFPRDYWIDEIEFYKELYPENDNQVYSICVSRDAASNNLLMTWNHLKPEIEVDHEVRYAFSNIHVIGWSNAAPAPNGVVSPSGSQGYNGMSYTTKEIDLSGQSTLYLAIKPRNSSVFSQVAFPLAGGSVTPALLPPKNLRILP